MRLAVRILPAAALVLTAAAAGSAAPPRTVVHTYVAYRAGKLAPGLHVYGAVRGRCLSSSTVDGRRYAWSCSTKKHVYDPCFASGPHVRTVVCPERPWSKRVLLFHVLRPTGFWQDYHHRADFPWGIRTTAGKDCFSLAGTARGQVAGKPITYECLPSGFLAGHIHKATPVWTIQTVRAETALHTKKVRIAEIWN